MGSNKKAYKKWKEAIKEDRDPHDPLTNNPYKDGPFRRCNCPKCAAERAVKEIEEKIIGNIDQSGGA